jgi:hypothetical protein
MKSFLALLAIGAFASFPVIAFGQGASPSPAPAAGMVSGSGGSAGSDASMVPLPAQGLPTPPAQNLEKNMPLIPQAVAPAAGKPGKAKKSGQLGANGSPAPRNTFAVESDIRIRVKLRIAETQAMDAPEMKAQWVAAHATKDDPDRRAALEKYYNHLYDRIIKIDPSITENANIRRTATIQRLHYSRLGDLPPSDDPYATPPPASEGVNPPVQDEGLLY